MTCGRKIITLKNVLLASIICLTLIGLIPLVYVAFHNYPVADDFGYSAFVYHVLQAGASPIDVIATAINTSASFYQSWQGLYTSAVILALQPGVFGVEWYWVTTAVLWIMSFLAFYVLARACAKHLLKSTSKAWRGLAFFTWFFFIQTLPSPFQGYYWWNGAVNYLFFWSLVLFAASLAITFLKTESHRAIKLAGLSLLSFLIAGGNHVTTIACIMALFACMLIEIKEAKSAWLCIPLVLCCAGLLIVMVAPGTTVRAASLGIADLTFSQKVVHFIKSTVLSFIALGQNVGSWLSLSSLLYLLLITPCMISVVRHAQAFKTSNATQYLLVFFFFVVFLGLQFLPDQYAENSDGSGRLKNVVYASYLLALWCLDFFVVQALCNRGNFALWTALGTKSLGCYFAALLVIMFSYGSGFYFQSCAWKVAFDDIAYGRIASYAKQNLDRFATLEDKDAPANELPALSDRPNIIEDGFELTDDPSHWRNAQAEQYYNKDIISIVE